LGIAELAARINPLALGVGNPMNNPNNPLVKKRIEAEALEKEKLLQ
jgi:hypothetical protein